MIVIRREQMKAFEKYVDDAWVRGAVERIAMQYPRVAARMGDDGALALARDCVARARGYGITGSAQVDRYLDLIIRLSPRFDEDPQHDWVRFILDDPELDEKTKMDSICESDMLPAEARG